MDEPNREEIYESNRQALHAIQSFLRGDSRAFHILVDLFGSRVERLIHKMVASHHDAEDLVNEVWLKVASNLHKFDQSLPFHSWLYRLTSNTCIDFLRKKREITMEDDQLHYQLQKAPDYSDTPESLFLKKEFQRHLTELLSHLDEVDRLIMTLRFSEELSYDQIGEIVGMSKNTVGTRLFRARKLLKGLWDEQRHERRAIHATY